MKAIVVTRLIVALTLSFVYALYVHHYYSFWHDLGRDYFLRYQGYRFDKHTLHVSVWEPITTYGTCVLMRIGVYELCANALVKLSKHFAKNPASASHVELL